MKPRRKSEPQAPLPNTRIRLKDETHVKFTPDLEESLEHVAKAFGEEQWNAISLSISVLEKIVALCEEEGVGPADWKLKIGGNTWDLLLSTMVESQSE